MRRLGWLGGVLVLVQGISEVAAQQASRTSRPTVPPAPSPAAAKGPPGPVSGPEPEPEATPAPARTTAPVVPSIDGEAIVGPGHTVLLAKLVPERELVHVVLAGDAPSWDELRALAREAYGRLDQVTAAPPDYSLFLQFMGNDRVSLSSRGVPPLVGNGYTMLDDPSAYAISATPRAKTLSTFSFTSGDSAVCSGDLANLRDAPLDVTVRCKIIGTFKGAYSFSAGRNGPATTAVMAEKTKQLKAVRPGKPQKYSFGLGKLSYPPGQSSWSYGNEIAFATTFEVDGQEVPHFDQGLYTEGLAWLTLLDGVRPLGFQVELIGNKWQRGDTIVAFTRPAGWSAPPYDKAAKADAGKLWKLVSAHLKKHFKKKPLSLWLRDKGITVAKIENGKLLEGGP